MTSICAWCGKPTDDAKTKDVAKTKDETEVSHSICLTCKKKVSNSTYVMAKENLIKRRVIKGVVASVKEEMSETGAVVQNIPNIPIAENAANKEVVKSY